MTAVPAPWDGEEEYDDDYPVTRRERRNARLRDRAQAREQRWQAHRLAVPYRTDGPKVTFGILWLAAILAAALNSPIALSVVFTVVAGLAGLQIGYAWFPSRNTHIWTAAAAVAGGFAGFLGPIGLVVGLSLALAVVLVYILTNPTHARSPLPLLDVLMRSSIPVGIAAASVAALADFGIGAVVSLIVLVSAYETGDFLVGSGSSNAVEGPISGLVGLAAALFILWIAAPAPFTASSILLFGALAAVCCPLGQILASGLLPRGAAWAPALRRLDSYLLTAPLWLLLLNSSSTSTTL